MTVTLFHFPGSPPSRGVLLTVRNLGVDVEIKTIDITAGENRTPEYLKLNPLGKIPSLRDGSFVLGESCAISSYLANSKAPGNSLYPADPQARALVDSRMLYDATTVFPKVFGVIGSVIHKGEKTISQSTKDEMLATMKVLDGFLEANKFIAGDNLTIADLSVLSNVSSIFHMGFDMSECKKLMAWYKSLESIPGYEENEAGAESLGKLVKSKLES